MGAVIQTNGVSLNIYVSTIRCSNAYLFISIPIDWEWHKFAIQNKFILKCSYIYMNICLKLIEQQKKKAYNMMLYQNFFNLTTIVVLRTFCTSFGGIFACFVNNFLAIAAFHEYYNYRLFYRYCIDSTFLCSRGYSEYTYTYNDSCIYILFHR